MEGQLSERVIAIVAVVWAASALMLAWLAFLRACLEWDGRCTFRFCL